MKKIIKHGISIDLISDEKGLSAYISILKSSIERIPNMTLYNAPQNLISITCNYNIIFYYLHVFHL